MWWLSWLACASTPEALYERGQRAVADGDPDAAEDHWASACDQGHGAACVEAAALDHLDAARRAVLNEAACEHGLAEGCMRRSAEPGDRWVQRACELADASACLAAGIAADDPEDAARWLGQACHDGDGSACVQAGTVWAQLGRLDRAAALADRGCEVLPSSSACAHATLWRRLAQERSECERDGGARCVGACEQLRDPQVCGQILEAAAEGCEGGDARSCTVRAEAGVVVGDPDDTINGWLWRGCDTVDPLACLRLADRLEAGRGERPPAARGGVAWLRNQACDLQLDYACAPHAEWP